ncbi:hypothetical protein J6590_082076 [Homalodisca vitripennis]|nr:hypothetical protein J6590_082076 [Homalodisca vitripennis]
MSLPRAATALSALSAKNFRYHENNWRDLQERDSSPYEKENSHCVPPAQMGNVKLESKFSFDRQV